MQVDAINIGHACVHVMSSFWPHAYTTCAGKERSQRFQLCIKSLCITSALACNTRSCRVSKWRPLLLWLQPKQQRTRRRAAKHAAKMLAQVGNKHTAVIVHQHIVCLCGTPMHDWTSASSSATASATVQVLRCLSKAVQNTMGVYLWSISTRWPIQVCLFHLHMQVFLRNVHLTCLIYVSI